MNNMNNMNNIKKNNKKRNNKKKKNKAKYTGGFCEPMGENCERIEVTIDPASVLDTILKALFSPINFLMRGIFYTIKFIIEYWNDLIIRISYVFEDLIINVVYTINGYINVFNMITNELKTLMTIALALLTNNPISLLSIWFTPIAQEFSDFILDSATIQIFTSFLFIDFSSFTAFINSLNVFRPLLDFLTASFYLMIGKTIKPKCEKNLYGNNSQKNKYCHEYDVPKCRLNIRTVYNIVFYTIIILYFAGWLSFFKIFYKTESNVSILSYLRNRYS